MFDGMEIARFVTSKFSLTTQFFRYSHVLRPLCGLKRKKSAGEQWGFTLIELLVVSALIGFLAVMSSTILSSILRSQNKTTIINEVRQNGNIVIDKFERDVKQAKEISPIGSGTNVTLTLYDGTPVTWDCSGSNFTRDPDGSGLLAPVSVTNSDLINGVQVNHTVANDCDFTVTGSSGGGTPQLVQLIFTLEQGASAPSRAEFEASVEFEVTVGTRAY